MKHRYQLVASLISGLVGVLAYAGMASAQNLTCSGTTCPLGGQR